MRKSILTTSAIALLALTGCMTPSEQRVAGGAALGGALGLITSKALGSNDNWTVLTTLGGAAAGAMVARNQQTRECAYARGDGTYAVRPCP